MANQTIYPYGIGGEVPDHVVAMKLAQMESCIGNLAPLAFRGTPNYPNAMYRDVAVIPQSTAGVALLRYGYVSSQNNWMMSPIFQLGETGDDYKLTFSVGRVASGQYPGLVYFNENYEYSTYNVGNANPRTVTGSVGSNRYVRILFSPSDILDTYLLDEMTGEYLFRGSAVDTSAILSKESFLESQYWVASWGPNSRGDWIGWNFANSDNGITDQRTVFAYPYFKQVGESGAEWSHSISKIVELPQTGIDIEFSCGVVDSGLMLRLLNPETQAASYYAASANPRTVTVSNTYTHVQLYFLKENYESCYIKDATNNEMLWEGAASLE